MATARIFELGLMDWLCDLEKDPPDDWKNKGNPGGVLCYRRPGFEGGNFSGTC